MKVDLDRKSRRRSIRLLAATIIIWTTPVDSAPPGDGSSHETKALGRLFFTSAQRAALEHQRQQNIQNISAVPGDKLKVDGVVRSSAGRTTAWVNGIAYHDADTKAAVRIGLSAQDPSRATSNADRSTPLRIRVGQSVDRATGETTDGLLGGRVVIKRKKP